jgi:hypothetical protein
MPKLYWQYYGVLSVPVNPGTYTVTVRANGFATQTSQLVAVEVGRTVKLNMTMTLSATPGEKKSPVKVGFFCAHSAGIDFGHVDFGIGQRRPVVSVTVPEIALEVPLCAAIRRQLTIVNIRMMSRTFRVVFLCFMWPPGNRGNRCCARFASAAHEGFDEQPRIERGDEHGGEPGKSLQQRTAPSARSLAPETLVWCPQLRS